MYYTAEITPLLFDIDRFLGIDTLAYSIQTQYTPSSL